LEWSQRAAAGPAAGIPVFGAGTTLRAVAFLLISVPTQFAAPVRLLGLASAILFAITGARIFWGG